MNHVDTLRASGLEGADLETSLRAFVLRSGRPESEIAETVRGLRDDVRELSALEANCLMSARFGQDAVRVASALVARFDG